MRHIAQKQLNSQYGNFTSTQNELLRIFFDLCQECESLEELYEVAVGILKWFFEVNTRIYLYNEQQQNLKLVCDSSHGLVKSGRTPPEFIRLSSTPYTIDTSFLTPIYNRQTIGYKYSGGDRFLLGMLEVDPCYSFTDNEYIFLEIFANRLGCNIYNFSVALQNREHIAFIKNLVKDIEHNVIVPNMYFNHLFNRFHKKIREMEGLKKEMEEMKEQMTGPGENESCKSMLNKMAGLYDDLCILHDEFQEHHRFTTLFLESLCRKDHFEQGHLVLRLKECSVDREIIAPQLARYQNRFQARGIEIQRPADMVDEEIPLRVDMGLLSQVYANLFSNAAKHTRQVRGVDGKSRKTLAYGREIMPDYFGPGGDGIKFNVFTTGPHIPPEERDSLFMEGYQGKDSSNRTGSGHGLSFIKQVVEIHGGVVGYEPTLEGNNFYFILPLPDTSHSSGY